ncbi:MAG TPA: type II secretion system secretin GspD [Stellaceae bacterium]|nr:type II secretion system secretin GspD [Stellaceae bacterium]
MFGLALIATSCTTPATAPEQPRPAAAAPAPLSAAPTRLIGEPDTLVAGHPLPPTILPGTGIFFNEAVPPRPTAEVSTGTEGAVTFNFINADVRDVLREILGDQLHVSYTIDSRIQGTITAQTGGPLPRAAVLPALESILQANGLGLVETNGVYRVLPIADAAKGGLGAATQLKAGYGIRILPLSYVSAGEIKGIIDPFLPPGSAVQVDAARNLLIVSGPMADLNGVSSLVDQFDVDWLRGVSFGLYPLQVGTAKDVAGDLNQIFGSQASGPLAGVVRIVPLERLNAILVVSPQRGYLGQAKAWIDRFDFGADEMTPRIFEYHVQNSRAADLAAVLTKLLSSGQVSTVQPTTAPGSRVAALLQPPGAGGAQGPGGTTTPGSSAIGAPTAGTPSTGIGTIGAGGAAPAGQGAAAQPAQAGQGGQTAQEALAPSGIGGGTGAGNLELPPVRIVADEKNNALVVYARPRDYRMIFDVIKRLDVVPLQVMIEATVAEVTLNDNLSYGLQFFLQHGANNFSLNTAATPPAPTGGIGAVGDIAAVYPGFNYVLSTAGARAILSALSSVTHVNVVSSPQLLVLDHQTAALQVGDQVPILTQQATSTVTATPEIVNSVSYMNTGVLLQVTPRVNESGLIALEIDQEVSNVTAATTSTTSETSSPTISQRQIVTSVVVQDGQTVALGGLIQDSLTKGRTGIPLLSDIPVVGMLFGGNSNAAVRTELLILLAPKIIRNSADARAITDELRDRMRAVKPLDSNKH